MFDVAGWQCVYLQEDMYLYLHEASKAHTSAMECRLLANTLFRRVALSPLSVAQQACKLASRVSERACNYNYRIRVLSIFSNSKYGLVVHVHASLW